MTWDEILREIYNKAQPDQLITECYKGDTSDGAAIFECQYDHYLEGKPIKRHITVVVKRKMEWIDGKKVDTDLYECELNYSNSTLNPNQDLEEPFCQGFTGTDNKIHVLAGLDLKRMKEEPLYAEPVLIQLFHKKRIQEMHDRFYEQHEEPVYGNYVGTVVTTDDDIFIQMDDEIGKMVANSSDLKQLAERPRTK